MPSVASTAIVLGLLLAVNSSIYTGKPNSWSQIQASLHNQVIFEVDLARN